MCELFGLSANRDVSISFTWRGFLKRGRLNYHGWGVAWYLDKYVGLVKEPKPAHKSPIARLLVNGVEGHIVISHVRFASQGGPSYVNTHPFVRKLHDYEWVFAHNGDVSGIINKPGFKLKCYFPVGETDSEYAFCYIMDNLRKLGDDVESIIRVSRIIWNLANKIGSYGKFNFLLSNSDYLFAYMNRPNTLHYLLRHPSHKGRVKLIDEDFEVKLEEIKEPNELAALIATKPLTNEDWKPFELNTLYVFHKGDVIMKVNANGELEHMLSEIEADVLRYVRTSPHSVKLKDISKELKLNIDEVYRVIEKLIAKGFLRQHSRDLVPPNHPEARFYTEPNKREIIDTLIVSHS